MTATHFWTDEENSTFARLFKARASRREINEALGWKLSKGQYAGRLTKLRLHRPPKREVRGLPADHKAVLNATTLFPSRVRDLGDEAVLTPGDWQKKLGARVTKGAWAGMPIFALTLEERATCPRSCHHWLSCYGNGMNYSWRQKPGPQLEERIALELARLQFRYPGGFVIRLHVLGDFYSVEYVRRWSLWLGAFPALRVFGYSAWGKETPIGATVHNLARRRWDRFAIRQSQISPGARAAITLWNDVTNEKAKSYAARGILVCPMQTERTRECGTCGLCWAEAAQRKTIGFLAHGR